MTYKRNIRLWLMELILIIAAVMYIYPAILMVSSSFKTYKEAVQSPFSWPSEWQLNNYVDAWKHMEYPLALFNTLVLVIGTLIPLILIGSMAAFALQRWASKLHNVIFILFLAGIMMPGQMAIMQLYQVLRVFKMTNSYIGVICIYLGGGMSFVIFMLVGFLKTIPKEFDEVATIDGCGLFRIFYHIVFPLLKPAIVSVAILQTIGIWNDFLTPLLYLQSKSAQTLTVKVYSFVGERVTDYTSLFPALVLAAIPFLIAFVILQRQIIEGVSSGAIKG